MGNLRNTIKSMKGITLIALVITIILLLILAGVSIATLTESGLFEKARQAEQKSENAQIEEESTLGDYENKIGEYVSGSNRETVTLTKEEYEIFKNMTTISTEEKVVGTLNNQKIYKRIIQNVNVVPRSGGSYWYADNVNIGVSNIDTIILADAISSGGIMPICICPLENDGYVNIRCLVAWNIDSIILQYTKTTD